MKTDSYHYEHGITPEEGHYINIALANRMDCFDYWGSLHSFHFPQSRYQFWMDPVGDDGEVKQHLMIILPEAILIAWRIENDHGGIEEEYYEIVGSQAASEIVDILSDDDARFPSMDQEYEYIAISRDATMNIGESEPMAWPSNWDAALNIEVGEILGKIGSDWAINTKRGLFPDRRPGDEFNIGVLKGTVFMRTGNLLVRFMPLSISTIQDDLIRHCKLLLADRP